MEYSIEVLTYLTYTFDQLIRRRTLPAVAASVGSCLSTILVAKIHPHYN